MPLLANIRRQRLNRAHPIARGMLDCLIWNEAGPTRNLVNEAFNAALTNPTDTKWVTTAGGPGGLVTATGPGSFDVPNHCNYAAGDLSVRVKFLPLVYPGTFTGLFSKSPGSGNREVALFINASGNTSYIQIGDGGVGTTVSLGLTTGQVWDLVMTRAGTTLTFYVNGAAFSVAGTFTGTGASGGSLCFGRDPNAASSFDGVYITAQTWNRAISQSEIIQLYADPYCFLSPDLPTFGSVATGGGGFTAKFRRTLSPIGTRIGARQGQAA